MRVSATAKYLRGSTRKARLITEAIKGKPVEEAAAILQFMPQAAARDVSRCLLRHEPQERGGLLDRLALDGSRDEAGLARRSALVLGGRGHTHRTAYFSAVDRSVCLPCPR